MRKKLLVPLWRSCDVWQGHKLRLFCLLFIINSTFTFNSGGSSRGDGRKSDPLHVKASVFFNVHKMWKYSDQKICKNEWLFSTEFWEGGRALVIMLTIHARQDLREFLRWTNAHEISHDRQFLLFVLEDKQATTFSLYWNERTALVGMRVDLVYSILSMKHLSIRGYI